MYVKTPYQRPLWHFKVTALLAASSWITWAGLQYHCGEKEQVNNFMDKFEALGTLIGKNKSAPEANKTQARMECSKQTTPGGERCHLQAERQGRAVILMKPTSHLLRMLCQWAQVAFSRPSWQSCQRMALKCITLFLNVCLNNSQKGSSLFNTKPDVHSH